MRLALALLNSIPVFSGGEPSPNQAPPTEFLLFPKGAHTSEKGTFTFSEESAKAVMARAAEKGNDIPIDYEHGMLADGSDLPGDGPTPAAGWFNLEVRDGALWAVNVRWTERAANYLKQKEYRFMSPAFRHADGVIMEMVNCALVNLPAQHKQTPLVAAKDDEHTPEESKMETLLALLKLSKNASEAEATQVAQKLIAERAKLLSAVGKPDVEEALGTIAALKDTQVALEKAKEELLTLKAAARAAKVRRLVEQGIKLKKIAPAMKEQFIEQGMATKSGIKFLKSYLETAPTLVGTKKVVAQKDEQGEPGGNDAALRQVAQKMGVKFEDLKKQYETDHRS